MNRNQHGFSIAETLILVLSLSLLVFAGWRVWSSRKTPVDLNSTQSSEETSTNKTDETFSVVINPMVGGGFAGAVNTYEITSAGEVYNTTAPDYKTAVNKTLLKNITQQEVEELHQTFIESGVLELPSGDGPKYSGSAWKVTVNSKEHSFYDQSSPKFDSVKIKLKKTLGEDVKF